MLIIKILKSVENKQYSVKTHFYRITKFVSYSENQFKFLIDLV